MGVNTNNKFYYIALGLITLGLSYLTWQLFKPFLHPLAWATVISLVFYPLYSIFRKYVKNESIASSLTVIIIILVIIGPFSSIAFMLIQEITDLAGYIKEGHYSIDDLTKHPKINEIAKRVFSSLKISPKEFEKKIIEGITTFGTTVITNLTKSIGNMLGLFVDFVIMIFAIFFILKDGPYFIRAIKEYLPFTNEEKERLGNQIRDVVVSTVYGGLIVAVAQGIVTGITMAALGFKSPVLWGTTTFIVSFIPLIGAAGVWGPAAIYLFVKGYIIKGIIFVLVGIFIISMIDNILKPIIIGSRTKLPIVVIFFSVLGGLSFFGLIGLVTGPLVVALFFSVIQIFKDIYSESSEDRKA